MPTRKLQSGRALAAILGCALALGACAVIASALLDLPARAASAPLRLIAEPDAGIAPVDRAVTAARHTLDMTMYELSDPHLERLLAQDARRGVKIRVLLDGGWYGSGADVNEPACKYLRAHGIQVRWTPKYFALTHQKSIVIDGSRALIMTMNLTSRYYSDTRDFVVSDTRRADVRAIEAVFGADWAQRKLATAPDAGGALIWAPGAEEAQLDLISSARSSLEIEDEEMGDPTITDALCTAARRGVNVRITMTYETDWKNAFQQLTRCGVHVRTYAEDASLYIHAKSIEADHSRAIVESENFSRSSLRYNRELGISTAAGTVLKPLEAAFASDWAGARPFAA